MRKNIIGAKGGGGGSSYVPIEAANTLQSTSTARIIDVISEGEIEGLVNGLKSIYLNDTPVQNEDGTFNFEGVSIEERVGTPSQDIIKGFPEVESEIAVGVQVTNGTSVTRTITTDSLDALRVKIRLDSLVEQRDNGDLVGTSVTVAIDVKPNGGSFSQVLSATISGKTTSSYERSYRVELPAGGAPWDVRVRRVTPDSASVKLQNTTYWSSYTELTDVKLSYPDTALVGVKFDSQLFGSSIPTRAYDVKGLKIKVPSNYNAGTNSYSGIWDGTFQTIWSDNPAWVLYDILTNNRYGLGQSVSPASVDKWSLYTIGQYCDELVDDGFGGTEKRFTFNGVINSRQEAYNVVNAITSAFRGMAYWGNGTVVPVQDSPKDAVRLISPANVINGEFNYSGTALNARHSVVLVTWNDPADSYRANVAVVEDPDLIQRYGYRQLDVVAFGCTSKGQAVRLGRWLLYSEKYETETVTYKASFDHADVRPGDIVKIADPSYAGIRYGGRIADWAEGSMNPPLVQSSTLFHNATVGTSLVSSSIAPSSAQNRIALAFISWETINTDIDVSSVVWNGKSFTKLTTYYNPSPGTAHNAASIWYLLDADFPATSGTATVTMSANVTNDVACSIVQVSNAAQKAPGDPVITEPGTTTFTDFVTTGEHNSVILEYLNNGDSRTITNNSGQTRLNTLSGTDMVHVVNSLTATGQAQYSASLTSSGSLLRAIHALTWIEPFTPPASITVDAPVSLGSGGSFTLSYVAEDGAIIDKPVAYPSGTISKISLSENITNSPATNGMWILASNEVEPRQFRVMSILENEKNIFEITAALHYPDKFAAVENNLTLEVPSSSLLPSGPLPRPTGISAQEYLYKLNASVLSGATISCQPPEDSRIRYFQFQYMKPGATNYIALPLSSVPSFDIENTAYGTYKVRVRAVDAFGQLSAWQEDELDLLGSFAPPADVTGFSVQIVGTQANATWTPNDDLDFSHYWIRHSSKDSGADWNEGIDLALKVVGNSAVLPSLYGTYMIKAVDVSGVASENAATVVTTTAALLEQNVIETLTEDPTFSGTKTNMVVDSSSLKIDDTSMEGIYQFSDGIDLGAVYSSRITARIIARGEASSDIMSSWTTLAGVSTLGVAVPPESWSLKIQIRTTDDDPAGTPTWSSWTDLVIGNYTNRAFEFRVVANSLADNTNVIISELSVTVDMEDVVQSEEGLVSLTSGSLYVEFDQPFKVLRGLAVDVQDLATGDYKVISSKTTSGFNIDVYNAAGTRVVRNFDYLAKGYGKG